MKKIEIFGRTENYVVMFEAVHDLKTLTDLKNLITKPQVLIYSGLDVINFPIYQDEKLIGYRCIQWLFSQLKTETTENDIRQCILDNCYEDCEETNRLNKNYNRIYNRSVTFKPDIQNMIIEEISKYQTDLEKLVFEWEKENEQFMAEQKVKFLKYQITKVYQKTMPKGGEFGVDGYFDADITDNTNSTRFVARNVFDFGFYTYPKRFEGTEAIFTRDKWTPEEIEISQWLKSFSPFSTEIRM